MSVSENSLLNDALINNFIIMKKNIFIACFLFFFVSCQHRKTESVRENVDMCINVDSLSQAKLKVKTLRYIPLEATEQSLIRNITKIVYVAHCYYIFDRIAKKIIVFSDTGKYLYSINKVCGGPGEYVEPVDMDVAPNGDIYVADNATKKIVKYSKDGLQFEEMKVGQYFLSFLLVDNSDFLLADIRSKGILDIALAKYKAGSDNFSIIEPYEHAMKRMIIRYTPHLFFRSETISYYYARFTPFLYAIDKNGNLKRIKLITDKLPTEEKLIEWENNKYGTFSPDGFICDVSACYEADDYILLVTISDFPLYTFVDRGNQKVCNFQSLGKDLNGHSGIKGVANDFFVSYCEPSQKNLQRIIDKSDLCEESRQQFLKLNQEANPILMLFNFKIQ